MPRHGSRYRGKVGRVIGEEGTIGGGHRSTSPEMVDSKLKHFHAARHTAEAGIRRAERQALAERKMYLSQKVVAVLLGNSRRRFLRRMLKLWLVSCGVSKKQNEAEERNKRWRRACNCAASALYGVCAAHCELDDVEFAMPFDILNPGLSGMRATASGGLEPVFPSRCGSSASNRWATDTRSTFGASLRPPNSAAFLMRQHSAATSDQGSPGGLWGRRSSGLGTEPSPRHGSVLGDGSPLALPRVSSAMSMERWSPVPQEAGLGPPQGSVNSQWSKAGGRPGSVASWTTALPSADSKMCSSQQQLLEDSVSTMVSWGGRASAQQQRPRLPEARRAFVDPDDEGQTEAKHWASGKRCIIDAPSASIFF